MQKSVSDATAVELCPPDATLVSVLPAQEPHTGVTYVPSQFAVTFAHNGKRYAFHTLTKQLLETDLFGAAESNTGKEALIRGLFLVPEGKDECAYYQSVSALMRAYHRKPGHRAFMILPTFGCNARCVYCYEEGQKPISMTAETADAVVRYIVETHAIEPVKINWFGGEPLLRPDIIDRISEGLQKAGVRYRGGMVSNGSLITPEVIEKMKGLWNVTGIQISVDGCEADYIARKQYVAYHDYYRSVMRAISGMSEAGIRVIVRCNTDESMWDGVPQFLRDMSENVAHKKNVQVYFSTLDYVRRGPNAVALWEKILNARTLIREAGFEPYMQFGPKLSFDVFHCMADGGSVVIGPDGKLYPCDHCDPDTCFGDVFRGTTNEAVRTEFCRTDRVREKCRSCTFLPSCTSFAACPVQDADCRRIRELYTVSLLKDFIDRKSIYADGEDPVC